MSEEEKKLIETPTGNGAALPEGEAQPKTDGVEEVQLTTGFHHELNIPLVIMKAGPTVVAMEPNGARQLAVQMIGAALVAEQEAAKRHAPILAQATASAMQKVNQRRS